MEPRRQGEDRGRSEQRHRLQKGDQRAGEEGRKRERNRDLARRPRRAAAEHRGSVLEIRGDPIESVRDQHEDVRKRVAADREGEPPERVDVEEDDVGIRPSRGPIELVQEAAVRRGEKLPGDGAEERRRHERCHHQQAHRPTKRHVGARDQVSHRRRDRAADDTDRDRQRERRD